ncbi:MAG: hypothetical protein FWC32_01285, partial [Firmicutes bacterium]|nr:hypothetical protein [Bacillota bacterium]
GDVVFGNYLIPFYVADSAGRNVYVFISYTSRQILGMSTVSDSTAMLLPPVPFGTLLTYRPVAGGILSAYSWEITPPLWQPVPRQPAPISSFVSDEFVWPNLTVYEVRHTIGGAVLTNPWELIPAEDAAQYAAMYIWELFGMCIDGTAVEMSFSTSWEDMHIWQGVVLHEPCEATMAGALVSRSQECELFAFTINAVTGEMASIRRFYGAMPTSCYTITEEDWQQIREGITQVHYMHPEKEFGQAIEEYIRRMTKGGQPIRLAYQFSEPVVFERDENGSIIATVFHMYFDAHFVHHPTDEARRVVNLSIESETGKLAWMFVQR